MPTRNINLTDHFDQFVADEIEAGAWTPQVDAAVPAAPAVRILSAPEAPLTADDVRVGENGFAFSPQGGLRASVRDLDALARAYSRLTHGGRGG